MNEIGAVCFIDQSNDGHLSLEIDQSHGVKQQQQLSFGTQHGGTWWWDLDEI
jgi:hypothetical protein